MAEYIEKQAAIDELCYVDEYNSRSIATIREMKPADVRPVKRGEWLHEDSASNYLAFKCSVCGTGGRLYKFPFCSQCGADMRGGDTDGGKH